MVVTKDLPGERWLQALTGADCRVEICQSSKPILDVADVKQLIGDKCSAVLGQLTEVPVSFARRGLPQEQHELALSFEVTS